MVGSNTHGNSMIQTGVRSIQDSKKVATDKGVHVLEKVVMLLLNGVSYRVYLRQPLEPQFHGKLLMDHIEDDRGRMCGANILIKVSALLAREGIL